MTSHEFFAEATANRIWSHFFGRGIVNPVDDFRSTNPPTHPGLLAKLSEDFVAQGYRLKPLMRRIVLSRTYQLSSRATNRTRPTRSTTRTPAAGADAEIPSTPSRTSPASPAFLGRLNRGAWKGGMTPGRSRRPAQEGDLYPTAFFDAYGRPNRFSVPERDVSPKLTQALHMLAGTTYNDKLWKPGARVYDLVQAGASDEQIIEELYLAAFSRTPTPAEQTAIQARIGETPTREQALQDLQWAIVSARELAENH